MAVIVVAGMAPTVGSDFLDLRVYRGAVEAMLSGHGLYDSGLRFGAGELSFLYPPFAALLVAATLWMPIGSAGMAWLLAQIGMASVLVWLMLRQNGSSARASLPGSAPTVLLALGLFMMSQPVLEGFALGQMSLFIVMLSTVDLLLLPSRWRGVLVGVSAAIKLTPLFFVALFLVNRQWRAAATAVSAFVVSTGLGFVVLPAESFEYWTRVVFDTSRVPGLGFEKNLTILGQLMFWGVPDAWQRPAWVVLAAVVATTVLWRARQHWRAEERTSAVLVAGVGSSLVSPVAWPHLWVWLPMVAVHLTIAPKRATRVVGWVGLVASASWSPVWPPVTSSPGILAVIGCAPVLVGLCLAVLGLPREARVRV
ncbi:hypothetical protein PROP_02712 [Propionicimonas sp. T2.31MG-18]|uniref:glycosyltransferase 87 family protein n=1 Tax=Propionicimonas sp. T2.31MG-18 TaxID=3157620 RepID=UPI0035EA7791